MTDVQDALRAQFESALTRAPNAGGLEVVLRRGRRLRRGRNARLLASAVAGVVALGGLFVASRPVPAGRTIAPAAPGAEAPLRANDVPATALSDRDRAGLAAVDAVHRALDLPREDGRYPYYAGIRKETLGTWIASFHMMSCSAFEACDGAGDLITISIEVNNNGARVSSLDGALSEHERDALLSYQDSQAAGERRFHIFSSWLRKDDDGRGVAVGSYGWQGAVPTYGYLYQCSAKVYDASGNVLYQGTEHPVPLPAPDQEELRSGMVGIPVVIDDRASSAEVSCDQEESAEIPQHISESHPADV